MNFIKLTFLIGTAFLVNTSLFAQCPTIQMSGTHLNCYGDANGSAAVSVTSGVGPFTYTWSTGATVTSIGGLPAGTYTVNVKDNGTGCTVLGAFTVNSPGPLAVSGIVTDVSCFGGNNGSVGISVTGGTPPYSYSWSSLTGTFADPQNLTNASSGIHTLTVRDNNGCQIIRSFTITQPSQALGSSITSTNVSCFAGANGTIDLSVFGGSPGYTFSWNTGQVTEDISTLSAGTYSVVVTDSKGCTHNNSIVITQPTQLFATTTPFSVTCFGYSDGSITANVNGGTIPYSYVWQSSSFTYGVNNAVLADIPSDIYQVNVTDAKGCQISSSGLVDSPTELISSISGVDVSCHGGNNGQVNLTVNGSVPAYNFQWSNELGLLPQTTQNLSNVVAGDYSVVITDQNGCTNSESITINQPEYPLAIGVEIKDVDCYNTNTGSLEIDISGGTPAYFISWSNGASSTLNDNLFAGNFSVTVTDVMGCVETGIYMVNQPSDTLFATHLMSPVICFGESNGAIDMIPSGGTTPYTYEWANSSFQLSTISQDLIDFPADEYYFKMIDAKGCVFQDTIEITEPPLLTGFLTGTDVLCKGNNTGEVDLYIQGGVPSYTYLWNNSQITQDIINLIAGDYDVTVTDMNNCTFNTAITITEPQDSLRFTYTTVDVTCHGGNDGEIVLSPYGGTSPYFVDWSSADNTFIIGELTAGMYSFILTDNNGCIVEDSMEIFQPEPLLANEVVTDVTCFGFTDGIIDISPSGGTAPYTYTWYNSTFTLSVQEEDLINFPTETYQLVITDSLNCTYQIFIELPEPEPLTSNFETTNVTCAGGFDGLVDLEIYGGNPGYTYAWSNGVTTQDLLNAPLGNYSVTVTDTKNCQLELFFIIYEPNPVEMTFMTTDVSCIDQLDGSAMAMPTGGTGSYDYSWSTGSSVSLADGLVEGWYWVTVTDIVGCTGTDSVYVQLDPSSCIDPPSAFTPNGDNYNDTWVIRNLYLYPEMHIQVFNRWGNVVFFQDGGEYIPWDGTFKGEALPSETYYYILILNEEYDPFKGTVTIVR